jgi:LytS/YehU family sensor histidine kinase
VATVIVTAGVDIVATSMIDRPAVRAAAEALGRRRSGGPPLGFRLVNNGIIALGVVAAGLARSYSLRYRARVQQATRLQAQLAEARLDALRQQLDPHFLFNTLNTIATLVREQERDAAVRLLAQLGDVLRQVLRSAGEHEVRFGDELAFTRQYLDIEQLRFADRLRVVWNTEPGTLEAAVPNLLLQPLVENAIKHGVGRALGPGESTSTDGGGVGLTNVRARLAALHGEAAELRVESLPIDAGGGARATIVLPWYAGVAGPRDGEMPATEGALTGATEPAGG